MMFGVPAIYTEPDDPLPTEEERAAAYRVVADAATVLLRKTGREMYIKPTITRVGPKLPDVPMAQPNTSTTAADSPAVTLFRTVAAAFPEADTDVVLCFVRGIETDGSGLGASRAGYLSNNSPGIGILGWANMVSALRDPRALDRRIEYVPVVIRAVHEIGHVMGLPHPPGDVWRDLTTVMGYAHGQFAMGIDGATGAIPNPNLFTPQEMEVIKAHPLLSREAWRPGALMSGIYYSDVEPIIRGKWPMAYAGIMGMMIEDYAQ